MIGVGTSLLFGKRAGKAGPPIPPFNEAMVDAWFMSGPSNSDKPSSITGVMGNEIILKNFDFTSESGFGKGVYDGALVFDGVDDYGICTGLPILDDYTVICRREIISSNGTVASKRTNGSSWDGAFAFERRTPNGTFVINYGTGKEVLFTQNSISYQTQSSYNGNAINRGTAKDTEQLSLGCSLVTSDSRAYEFLNCVIYYFALYNKSLTIEEIETEKERLNEEWLKRKN